MANESHYGQYSKERDKRWTMGNQQEPIAIKTLCDKLSASLNTDVGYRRYDEPWFKTIDHENPKYEWIVGVSDYVVMVKGCGCFYAEIKVKKDGLFRKTETGGTTKQGSKIENYGCQSLYLDIYPVYDHVVEFTTAMKIKPSEFYFVFFVVDTNDIYIISLNEITALIQNGYNGKQLCTYGEGYGKKDEEGNPAVTYLIPIAATHKVGDGDTEYFKDGFTNNIMYPVNIAKQSDCFTYSSQSIKCVDCGQAVDKKVHDFSIAKFNGRCYCYRCQKKHYNDKE